MNKWQNWSDATKWIMGIVSALLVTILITFGKWMTSEPTGLPQRELGFSVSNTEGPFAIKSSFNGVVRVEGTKVVVKVEEARFSYPEIVAESAYWILNNVRACLSEKAEESWKCIRISNRHEIDKKVEFGSVVTLDPFVVTVQADGLETLIDTWLTFQISHAPGPQPTSRGFSYVHTHGEFF